jgi:hypothetical protein
MRRQQVRHAADFAPAHRVGLAGEREGARARPADLPGRERAGAMSDAPLCVPWCDWLRPWHHIDSAAPASPNQRAARTMSSAGTPQDWPAMAGVTSRTVVAQGVEAGRVLADERVVDESFPEQHVEHRVEQPDVGAGQDRAGAGRRAPRCRCGAGRRR